LGTVCDAGLWFVLLALSSSAAAAADVALISQGRRVELEDHLVSGKLVLFDFYADWCAPCRILEPHLDRVAELHPETLAVRKIDVVEWESPVARQYEIGVLPHLILFGTGGELLAEGDPQHVLTVLEGQLGTGSTLLPELDAGGPALWSLVLVAAAAAMALVVLRQRRANADPKVARIEQGSAVDGDGDAAGRDPSAIWFAVVDGSLDGPLSPAQLRELVRRKVLGAEDRVRRRGDASWRRLSDVVDEDM
jgi:thiol-disulfide isomerase/thioredoxin